MMQDSSLLRSLVKNHTKKEIEATIAELPDNVVQQLLYDWPLWARENQLTPTGDWFVWLILAG
jgi:phage terminase large subunit-like protein